MASPIKRKIILKIAKYLGAIIIAFMVLAVTIFAGKPHYIIGGLYIENIDAQNVGSRIENKINAYRDKKLKFSYNNKIAYISPAEINAKWDANKTLQKLKQFRSMRFLAQTAVAPIDVYFDQPELNKQIINIYKDEIKQMRNASMALAASGDFKIIPGQEGAGIDEKTLIDSAKEQLGGLSENNIELHFIKSQPTITAEDLSIHFERIKTALKKNINLKYSQITFLFAPKAFLDHIYYQKEYAINLEQSNGESLVGENIKIKLNKNILNTPFFMEISRKIDKNPSPVNIYKNPSGKIIFEGGGDIGEEADKETLLSLMETAIAENIQTVKIPINQTQPEITASEELRELGIQKLIGVGHTAFYGSPQNRIHNIKVGIAKFNGIIIQPGEEFSFNKTLGKVDESTGYKKELVIKPEGTIPEYGGGICQVSTTMYRAIVYSGLPVAHRAPHSYAVRYYSQIGGHGLDATVYPGSHDLKFKNDTPAAILVQAYTEGLEAYYKFYGTNDGRKIELDGPYLSNYKSAGGEEITKTTTLPPGQKKQIEKAGKGFDAVWYRIITYADGEIKKEKISSSYRATANKFLVGAEPEEIPPAAEPPKQESFKD